MPAPQLTDAAKGRRGRWHPARCGTARFRRDPADVQNGDVASNIAMAGARAFSIRHPQARSLRLSPPSWAYQNGTLFSGVDIAGPGFINLFLGPGWFTSVVRAACAERGIRPHRRCWCRQKYNVEYVSANPTGPMHWATPAAVPWATVWPPPGLGRL